MHPERLTSAEALTALLPLVDGIFESYTEGVSLALGSDTGTSSHVPSVTCSKGCGACCHYPIISATAGEAFVLLSRLLASGRPLEELAASFGAYATQYFSHARSPEGGAALPFTDDAQRRFLSLRLPCPLFSKEAEAEPGSLRGVCSAFGARPLICEFFHSLDDPKHCALKRPHRTMDAVMTIGHDALEATRQAERAVFGRSCIGHLPLLLAALCTEEGLSAFLTVVDPSLTDADVDEAEAQGLADFSLMVELLHALGYVVTERDIMALGQAQAEALS